MDDTAFPVRPADEPGVEKADSVVVDQYDNHSVSSVVEK
jgi:hypothetical protein